MCLLKSCNCNFPDAHWVNGVDWRTGQVNKASHIKWPEFRYLWLDFHLKRKIIKSYGVPGCLEPPPKSLCNLRAAHYSHFHNSNKHISISDLFCYGQVYHKLHIILTMANIFLNKLPMNYYVPNILPVSLLVPPYYLGISSSFFRFYSNSCRF